MALKGTLKDFSVADIFQLIGQQGKSGSLYVRTSEKEAHIVFDGGKVVLGTFKRSDEEFLLGTILLRAGVISSAQLTEAIENQKTTMRSLGDILKTMGAINSTILSEFVSLQLKEVLFRMFQWHEGFYEFVPEKIQYNRAVIKPQSAEAVLMDGYRMLDEWPGILEKVGSTESVYKALADPARLEPVKSDNERLDAQLDEAFTDFGEDVGVTREKAENEEISAVHRKVLSLLDGKRSLQEVIYLSRLGTFDAMRMVADLVTRGQVEKVTELSPTRIVDEIDIRSARAIGPWIITSFRTLLAVFVIATALPVAAFGIRSHFSSRFQDPRKGVLLEPALTIRDLGESVERERITNLLALHHLQNGAYPLTLEELGDRSLAERWSYTWGEKRFDLTYRSEAE
jgi:hypothetical protein